MRQHIEQRLAGLKSEYEKGQTQLRQLDAQSASLRETLFRISGAIMVLEELLSPPVLPNSGGRHQADGIAADTVPSSSAQK